MRAKVSSRLHIGGVNDLIVCNHSTHEKPPETARAIPPFPLLIYRHGLPMRDSARQALPGGRPEWRPSVLNRIGAVMWHGSPHRGCQGLVGESVVAESRHVSSIPPEGSHIKGASTFAAIPQVRWQGEMSQGIAVELCLGRFAGAFGGAGEVHEAGTPRWRVGDQETGTSKGVRLLAARRGAGRRRRVLHC